MPTEQDKQALIDRDISEIIKQRVRKDRKHNKQVIFCTYTILVLFVVMLLAISINKWQNDSTTNLIVLVLSSLILIVVIIVASLWVVTNNRIEREVKEQYGVK